MYILRTRYQEMDSSDAKERNLCKIYSRIHGRTGISEGTLRTGNIQNCLNMEPQPTNEMTTFAMEISSKK